MTLLPGVSIQKTIVAVCMLFIVLIGLSIGQYQVISQHKKIATLSSRLLFQYTTVKEFATRALLDGRYADLQDTIAELENLNESVQAIVQNPLIPGQLKATLLNRLDLSGAVILVRQIISFADPQKITRFQEEIRIAGEQLLQFDRLVAEHVKRKLVGYQSFVIGVLLFSVLFLANVLFFVYLKLVAPLKDLKIWLEHLAGGENKAMPPLARLGWLNDIGRLLPQIQKGEAKKECLEFPYNFRLAMLGQLTCGVSHEISDAVNSLLNYQELALDSMGAEGEVKEAKQMVVAAAVEAEKIAAKVKLLLDAGLFDTRKEVFGVQQLFGETIALMRSQLRSDGIKVEQLFDPDLPRIRFSYGMARLVCLELMLWLCAIMTAATDRRMEIRAEKKSRDGRLMVRVSLLTGVADEGLLADPGKESQSRDSENAVYGWRCLVLLKNYLLEEGGELQLAATDNGTFVFVDFPADNSGERNNSAIISAAGHGRL